MKKVYVFLADGLEECEALLTIDLLRRAGLRVITVSIMGRKDILSSHKILFYADVLPQEIDLHTADAIVLPGGKGGTENLSANALVKDLCCKYAADPEKLVAAVCAAPSVLGQLGLLQAKKATCYPGWEEKLTGAEYTAQPVEEDGNIITGRALGATIPFALAIIRRLLDEEQAKAIAAQICYPYYNE